MVKAFQLFRESKPMDSKVYSNKNTALKEMKEANTQFKEFNDLVRQGKIDRKPIKLVRVKEVSFSRKRNVF